MKCGLRSLDAQRGVVDYERDEAQQIYVIVAVVNLVNTVPAKAGSDLGRTNNSRSVRREHQVDDMECGDAN
jgi:hypothetical protein